MGWLCETSDIQTVPIQIKVIAEEAGHGDNQRVVFISAFKIVGRQRVVVDRVDRDSDRGNVTRLCAVKRLIRKAVVAVEIGSRRICERAIGVQIQ